MERIRGPLYRSGRATPERLAAATLDAVQVAIKTILPNDQPHLRAASVTGAEVSIRAQHAAAAGRLTIHAQAVLEYANALLQKRFPGQPRLTEIRIIRR